MIVLTNKQFKYAKSVIRRHYGLKRLPTDDEVIAEIENLKRKIKLERCCDIAMSLRSRLAIGQNPIKL